MSPATTSCNALAETDIACVQHLMNLADRRSMPVPEECHARGIAFVPFFPLGSGFGTSNPVLASPQVTDTAACLGRTPAQVALAWLLDLRPEVLLIPGTSSMRHLEENMAVANLALDAAARELLASWHRHSRNGPGPCARSRSWPKAAHWSTDESLCPQDHA